MQSLGIFFIQGPEREREREGSQEKPRILSRRRGKERHQKGKSID